MNPRIKSCFTKLETLIRKAYEKKLIPGELANDIERAITNASVAVMREVGKYQVALLNRGPQIRLRDPSITRLEFRGILIRAYQADPRATEYELLAAGEGHLLSLVSAAAHAESFRKTG